MNIAFMGTPEFAVASLEAVHNSRHRIVAVVTGPDKRAGRNLRLQETAVKVAAMKYGVPILQPEDLSAQDFIDALSQLKPDIGVVVAFRILPQEVYRIPTLGCINLHPSLLPDLRGAAPINWALIKGYNHTGVTTFQIESKVDAGLILLQEKVNIDPTDDAGSLSDKLSKIGAELILETIDGLESRILSPSKQDGEVTRAPRISKEFCQIEWNKPAREIHNKIRGLSPVPAAYTTLNGKVLKIYRTRVIENSGCGEPGDVGVFEGDEIIVQTATGSIGLLEVQIEGRKRMTTREFQRGRQIITGTKLGL